MNKIKIAIFGIGNCASALVQMIAIARDSKKRSEISTRFPLIGSYRIESIEPVLAFDIDRRKVGLSLSDAIFAESNCLQKSIDLSKDFKNVKVLMGMNFHEIKSNRHDRFSIQYSNEKPSKIGELLKINQVDVVVNLLPTGSKKSTHAIANACLFSNSAFVNAIPVLIANSVSWASKFKNKNIPLLGDDLKSQFGSTALHQGLLNLLQERGVKILSTNQRNWGGNADFYNLQKKDIFKQKHFTKEGAILSILNKDCETSVYPCSFVQERGDLKKAEIQIEGKISYGRNIKIRAEVEVEDSPNAAEILGNAIRFCKIAKDEGRGGILQDICIYSMKLPPNKFTKKANGSK